ncbi:NADP-dependent oxidoreductase [Variovorax sp. J22P271]|uniref:NADP-dependent oxidoreductase n=1 Tax=Variovorax davisae TaxID=3053515 RepID=UPI00257497E5|nr:NADP-dependent oxidoreductase [Variovorax sp. J22P271]MDM0032398.1 NADP-dependent oxidoreductase [Variovorax sp. J22P271]
MKTTLNRSVRLTAYCADGPLPSSCFALDEAPVGEIEDGQVLVETHYLSMDPFPRLRMRGDDSMAPQLPLGSVVIGRGVGQVVASRAPALPVGTYVAGELGWQALARVDGRTLRAVDPTLAPVSTSLGLLGPSGLTAYFTVMHHGKPREGETVVISGAAGSVGSVSCQLAKQAGARVVAIVGGQDQAHYLLDEIRADVVVDHTIATPLAVQLARACPQGVDVFLDGVGGSLHEAVMDLLNVHARAVVYGVIASYGRADAASEMVPSRLYQLIQKRVRLSGFLIADHADEFASASAELSLWLAQGRVRCAESITEGLENAPAAFAALFTPGRFGKQLVRLAAAAR